MKIIIINGGQRTGSTLSYNLVREIFIRHRVNIFSFSVDTKFCDDLLEVFIKDQVRVDGGSILVQKLFTDNTTSKYEACILKCHNYLHPKKLPNVQYITTTRNAEDTKKSMQRTIPNEHFEQLLEQTKKVSAKLRTDSHYIPYKSMLYTLPQEITALGDFLGYSVSEDVCSTISAFWNQDTIRIITSKLLATDPITELRPAHVEPNIAPDPDRPYENFEIQKTKTQK